MSRSSDNAAFTLIELLVVVAILAILFIVVLLVLNPAQLLMQARDSNRLQDLADISDALNLFSEDVGSSLGSANTVYVSIPDPTATTTAGDACQGLALLSLPANYTYHCAASSTYRSVAGNGWIPVNLSSISVGSPLSELPIDPTNTSSSRLYYTYATNGSQYELTASMESAKYGVGGSNDVISDDGGPLATVYEKGTAFGLEPLDYGDPTLVGWWPLNEGTGTVAYDDSGNNATGSWNGTQVGTNGYYTTNAKVGAYAGDFDGSTDYVNTGNQGAYASNFSICAWILQTATSSSEYSILEKRNGSTAGWAFGIATNGQFIWRVFNGSAYNTTRGQVLQANTWYFLCIAQGTGGTVSMYENGSSLVNNYAVGTPAVDATTMRIGYPNGGAIYFYGLISDVRIYDRALSAAQIAAMYSGGK